MLDGASRIGDVVAAAAADGQPAVGITDHGNMYGVLDIYQACARRGHQARSSAPRRTRPTSTAPSARPSTAGRRLRRRGRGRAKAYYHLTAAGRDDDRLPQPHPALEPRRTSRATTRSPRSTGSCSRTTTRGSSPPPAASAATCSRRCSKDDDAGALEVAGRLQDIFGRDNFFVELQDHGIADQHRTNPKLSRSRGRSARRCSPRTTATTRTRTTRGPRRAAVRADRRVDERPEPVQVPGRRALPQDARPRCAACSPRCPEACDNTLLDRRARRRRARVRQPGAAQLPGARGPRPRRRYLRELTMEGAKDRYGHSPPTRGRAARATSSTSSRRWGSPRTSSSCGTSSATPSRQRHPGRARAGERGRLVRGVLPAHRRHRPDQVRPAVRAVPQPGPQADARHRHGLRLPLPRRDDQVRGAALRRATTSRRSSRSPPSRRGPRCATRRGCSATRTASATRSPSSCRR